MQAEGLEEEEEGFPVCIWLDCWDFGGSWGALWVVGVTPKGGPNLAVMSVFSTHSLLGLIPGSLDVV